jgi:3-oxoacyl-(acyl-carrier-protein) synthase/aryl carrier-like protein
MSSRSDIAIVGMSGVFPGAPGLDRFLRNLRQGVDSVGPMPELRYRTGGFDRAKTFIPFGYLERIDLFDPPFFNISLREAEQMDPQQRFALELGCAAIESAGYALSALRGSRTAVCLAAIDSQYARLVTREDGKAVMGRTLAAVSGRVAYALDLRGPVLVVDTSCSSSLVAVHEACGKLRTGEADWALAGGVNLYTRFPEAEGFKDSLGIGAADGKSKSFDASADGTGAGEGAGIVLLRPLDRALADRDNVLAVIRGSAINNDGARGNGIASPSPLGQTEVILAAWERAGVEAGDIAYIEAHGTGTALGDPIEIQGLCDAFRRTTERRGWCALSSVKSNIGHLGAVAGISGLLKAVLSLQSRELFPSLHFERPSPHIDFESSPFYVNTRLRPWPDAGAPRRAGVSSFGLTGTNAHLVLEEAPPAAAAPATAGELLVTLSARTPAALRAYAQRLAEFLAAEEGDLPCLADLAYVLNAGRDDYEHRRAWVVRDRGELARRLEPLACGAEEGAAAAASEPAPVILLCAGDARVGPAAAALARFAPFRQAWEAAGGPSAAPESPLAVLAFQHGLCALFRSLGVPVQRLFGTGVGNLAVGLATGRLTLEQALPRVEEEARRPFAAARFETVARGILAAERPLFLNLGEGGILAASLVASPPAPPVVPALGEAASPLAAVARLYELGAAVDWAAFYAGQERRRVAAPTYPFERIRCWPLPILEAASAPEEPAAVAPPAEPEVQGRLADAGGTETEHGVAAIWGTILKQEELRRTDDFFVLGGDSLDATQINQRVRERFGIDLAFEVLFDRPTLAAFAAEIDRRRFDAAGREVPPVPEVPAILRQSRCGEMPLSPAQERLFHLYRLEPASPFYNMPAKIWLEGRADIRALEAALTALVDRHEVLRTTYAERPGGAVQRVGPVAACSLPLVDLAALPSFRAQAEAEMLAVAEARRAFRLESEPSLRSTLLVLGPTRGLLLLTMHHIASDGWSVGVLFRELPALYQAFAAGAPSPLPELAIQYGDFAVWHRGWLQGEVLAGLLAYWQRRLDGVPGLLTLSIQKPRPAFQSYAGGSAGIAVPAGLTAALRELSRGQGCTLFMTLLAAFEVLLGRYSGQDDFCIGSPIANRPRPETERLIGFFANTLALRADLAGNPPFSALLVRVRETVSQAFSHQDLPFERLVQELRPERSPAFSPLFQAVFVLQNAPMGTLELHGLALRMESADRQAAKFDLTLSMIEQGDGLAAELIYAADLYQAGDIGQLGAHFLNLLSGIVADPERPILNLPMLGAEEQRELVESWSTASGENAYDFD